MINIMNEFSDTRTSDSTIRVYSCPDNVIPSR